MNSRQGDLHSAFEHRTVVQHSQSYGMTCVVFASPVAADRDPLVCRALRCQVVKSTHELFYNRRKDDNTLQSEPYKLAFNRAIVAPPSSGKCPPVKCAEAALPKNRAEGLSVLPSLRDREQHAPTPAMSLAIPVRPRRFSCVSRSERIPRRITYP